MPPLLLCYNLLIRGRTKLICRFHLLTSSGCGAITLVCEEKKETHELRRGDILEAPAGAIIYMINKDSNEKLVLIKLIHPVSTPGRFEVDYVT